MKITKKKVVLCSIVSIILIGGFIISYNLGKSNSEVIAESTPKKQVNNSFLTLMLEDESGNYVKSTSNTWPSGNYAFNETLSRCENGGELRWNREAGIVELLSNKSDACYVYFDLYNVVTITNVSSTKTTNSVTLTVTVDAGANPVATYYFSMDGGNSYQESTSPNYTFSNLTPNTTYTFQVYAKDTEGYESNEEVIEVTTDNYVNPTVNSVTATNVTNNSITVSVNASGGTNSIARYYYSSNGGSSYVNTTSNTYTFSGLNAGTNYNIRVYVVDSNNVESNVYTINAETDKIVYYLSSTCNNGSNLASCIKNYYNTYGITGTNLYYHNSSLANGAGDNSYRYAGASKEVNNYVCFGSTASPCPSDNLYRIIGVFGNQVKLIKNTSYGNYVWDDGESNTWNSSTKPDIRNTLNTTFLNSLSSTWQNKIANHAYKVGGMTYSNGSSTPRTAYNYEVGSNSSSTTDSMKIGLMYVSDYGYAASNSYWTTNLSSYDSAASSNWMRLGSYEWTISRTSDGSDVAFAVNSSGSVHLILYVYTSNAVRPVFYLNSSITYNRGSGTAADPVRIN